MAIKKTIWLPAVVILGLLILLVVFFRQIAGFYLSPPSDFTALPGASQPDYASVDGWYAHPDKDSSAQLSVNAADQPELPASKNADVFFIHPTTFFGPGEWNSPASDEEFARQGIEHIAATVTSSFSYCCNIYMPRYRQAHLSTFAQENFAQGSQALEFAYQDVQKAFRQFVRERDPGRPFFLAGHSQGTVHGLRLLASEIEGSPLHDSLVAAYLIGYWLPSDILTKTLSETPLCTSPEQTSCLITYDTFAKTGTGKPQGLAMPLWYPEGWQARTVEQTLCVNPLSWKNDNESMDKTLNQGSLGYQAEFSLSGLLKNTNPGFVYESLGEAEAGVTGAQCNADGSLLVDSQEGTVYDNPGKGERREPAPVRMEYVLYEHQAEYRAAAHRVFGPGTLMDISSASSKA